MSALSRLWIRLRGGGWSVWDEDGPVGWYAWRRSAARYAIGYQKVNPGPVCLVKWEPQP